MGRIWFAAVAVLAFVPASPAQDKPPETPREEAKQSLKERYDALLKEYQDKQRAFSEEYPKAKTDEEQQKIIQEKYPNPEMYAGRMLKLAEEDPKGTVGFDALSWIGMNYPVGPVGDKTADLLMAHHLQSKKLGPVLQQMAMYGSPAAETLLRAVMEKSDDRKVRAEATFTLATMLRRKFNQGGDQKATKEAEKLFETIIEKYADVPSGKGKMGEVARLQLDTLRNLGIDKPAPEITGEDIDGKPLKLSDYKGKVVVLDFWGHW
jgi:hypothetical protein